MFKNIKQAQEIIGTIPLNFLPSDARIIKCADGTSFMYSPYTVDLDNNFVTNQVTGNASPL